METTEALQIVRNLRTRYDALKQIEDVLALAVQQENLLKERQAQLNQLDEAIKEAQAAKDDVQGQVKAAKDKFNKLMTSQSEAVTAQMNKLEQELIAHQNSLNEKLAAAEQNHADAKAFMASELDSLKGQKSNLETLVKDLTGQLDSLKKRFGAVIGG